jgi:hypothetical protein
VPDITVALSDKQQRDLEDAAHSAGMSVDEYAAEAFSHALSRRYVIAHAPGKLLHFKGLKKLEGDHER